MKVFGSVQRMGAAALIMSCSILLSRFAGLIRDKVISWNFGAGAEADVYFAAFVIPDFLNYLLAGGYFSITLIPLLTERFDRDKINGTDEGWRFFSTVFWWIVIATVSLTALAWICAPQLALLTAPGFAGEPEKFARLVSAVRIILPAQCFFLPGACLTALLYMRRQFFAPALTPLLYNAGIIFGGLVGLAGFGRGMTGFYWGVLFGAALGAFLVPLLAARAGGLRILPVLRDSGLKTFILLALPLMLGQSIMVLDEQFVRVFGSMAGEGAVSLLNYARRLMLVPVAVVAQAAGVASYPFLASLAAAGKRAEFDDTLFTALKNSLAVILPIMLWMMAVAEPAVQLVFLGGGFSMADSYVSAMLLRVMMLGVGFWAVQQVMGRAFYAHKNTVAPVIIGTLATVLALPLYWLATRDFSVIQALIGILPVQWAEKAALLANSLSGAVEAGAVEGAAHMGAAAGIAFAGVCGVALYTLGLAGYWQKRYKGDALAGIGRHCVLCLGMCLLPALIAWRISAVLPGYLAQHVSLHPVLTAFINLAVSGFVFGFAYLVMGKHAAPQILPDPLRRALDRLYGKS